MSNLTALLFKCAFDIFAWTFHSISTHPNSTQYCVKTNKSYKASPKLQAQLVVKMHTIEKANPNP